MTPERKPARPDDGTDHDRSSDGADGAPSANMAPASPPPPPSSDARRLQKALEGRWLGRNEAKWSPRRTLAFVIGASLLLWGLIIAGIAALL